MREENCGNCKYSEELPGNAKDVACNRYPPRPVVVMDRVLPYRPHLLKGSWCGEWHGWYPESEARD
jgi:hypothetical protein